MPPAHRTTIQVLSAADVDTVTLSTEELEAAHTQLHRSLAVKDAFWYLETNGLIRQRGDGRWVATERGKSVTEPNLEPE